MGENVLFATSYEKAYDFDEKIRKHRLHATLDL